MDKKYRQYNPKTMEDWTLSIITLQPPESIKKYLGFWTEGQPIDIGKVSGNYSNPDYIIYSLLNSNGEMIQKKHMQIYLTIG